MAHQYYAVAAVFLITVLIGQIISNYIAAARFKKAHGCKPVRRLPQSERILGVGLYKVQRQGIRDRRILDIARQRYRDHGPTWSASLMGQVFVNTIDPENIKTILATNFKDFGLGKRIESFGPLLGHGIFTTDGRVWEHSRALVRPNFTRAQVADLGTFETHIQHFFAKIPRDGSTVNLQSLFFQLTMDSATEFLFGESVGSLNSPEGSESHTFAAAFDVAQGRLSNRSRLGRLVNFCPDPNFDAACKTVHKFVDKIVERALERVKALDAEKTIDGKDQAERYVFLNELARATQNPRQLRDELLNIFLAGRDTTASLLSHTFHLLARRPDIWKKLKVEVDALNGEKPSYDTLRNLRYLKNLLNESLRLYPVVPANARFANKATTLPRGGGPLGEDPVYIAKGQAVAYSTWTMHRQTSIFGPDAEEFKPERWDSPTLRPGWGYLPFNGGPRICVGQQYALTEASYTIVRIVQEFGEIEERDEGRPWTEQLSLTLCVKDGVNVGLIPKKA
ncbi:N-alkane-inducible cytochrome P450 [Phlyctema vagabunda]|uniref:N-alkane-inducible cytochrome P450 n=1 Tax=Phlyctema vagabunda TaxID=108571 RepID=A0ABR4PFG9_9HELO